MQSGSFPAVVHPDSPHSPAYGLYTYNMQPPLPQRLLASLSGQGTATAEHRLGAQSLVGDERTSESFRASLDAARDAAAHLLVGTHYETIGVDTTRGTRLVVELEGAPATMASWDRALETLPERVRAGHGRSVSATLEDRSALQIPIGDFTSVFEFTTDLQLKVRRVYRGNPLTISPVLPYTPSERGPERADGTSAGLAYALSHLNHIAEGQLFGGIKVHASGTIGLGGMVVAVEGFPAKAEASRFSGADLLIVPLENLESAEGFGVEVVGVRTLAEAVEHLCSLASKQYPPPEICPN